MDILQRTQELCNLFSYDKKVKPEGSKLEIIPFRFTQITGESEIDEIQRALSPTEFCPTTDDHIQENKSFTYTVFTPSGKEKRDNAIILLHGLNERSWEKYLAWAEYLADETGKPVILFPIAFHMNRTPSLWYNPRAILPWVTKRKEEVKNISNSTFANVALSSRLSSNPLRFYISGRESVYNIWQLVHEIKNGQHPLFKEDTSVNLFAYSIGAMLSQVLLLSNPDQLFDDSRLFMFCGGSIFSEMDGNARDIMDKEAFDRLRHYFRHDFLENRTSAGLLKSDFLERAFKAMIRKDVLQDYRESFFQRACNRIRAISLKKDIVMPTNGIIEALGKVSGKILEELDFPFKYSHQIPFPLHSKTDSDSINRAFNSVFYKAAAFL
ncbi:DUF6051 family protein [Parabacteroides bouchesdurhonensis]|uniref:DUF6051 family protein n=1 Tax=Parabacteroides bouchesdurhonensis TaxID=1936995 RepID=UPI000E4F645F|nr:DUF6051 family protein [Parabacteroides bouchesdurhonensis]RHJ94260.1 hypothetical protein DW095_04380 [Bacteroides sp. AM07-16]